MKVLNIHGYHGSTTNAATRALMSSAIDTVVGVQIDYDNMDPQVILDTLCAKFNENQCDAVVGTSLGGFYAMLISAKYAVPVVLINPATAPGILLPSLGYNRCSGVRGMKTLEYTYLKDLDLRLVSTIIGTEDEVIPELLRNYTKALLHNSRYYEIEGGKHSGASLPLNQLFREHRKEWFDDLCAKDFP